MKIMKKNILLSMATALLFLSGCDYNDKYFDGLQDGDNPTDVKKVEYTLTEADYATIASDKTNQKIAEEAGVDKELAALKTTLCFTEAIPAAMYAPAFIASKWFTADDGSAVKLTYEQAVNRPDYLSDVTAAQSYKLLNKDYAIAWEDMDVYYFSPSKPAATFLPRILKTAVTGAEAGDYLAVEYRYSSSDPSTGGDVEKFDKIVDASEGPVGEYNVKGYVAATYARGFLLTDGDAAILVYMNKLSNLSIGDEVTVKGVTSAYGGFNQFQATAEVVRIGKSEEIAPVTYTALDAAAMDAYLTDSYIKPIKYTGDLTISGSYYNVAIEGATTAIGSLSYAHTTMIDPALDGKKITVYGYPIGTSSGKYVNTMVTKIMAADAEVEHASVAEVALGEAGTYTTQGTVVAMYARGFLMNDGSASILVYLNKLPEQKVGDLVQVTGPVTTYGGFNQFTAASEVKSIAEVTVNYPETRVLTGIELDEYIAAPYIQYVSYTGTLSISGSYYNVIIEDAITAEGSLSYPIEGSIDPDLNGKEVVVTGYSIGTSSSKYVNTMVLSVVEAATSKSLTASTRAGVEEKRYAMYLFDGTNWKAAEDMTMVNPADYSNMGLSTNYFTASNKPATYLSQYLKQIYPYVQEGDVKAATYFFGAEGDIDVDEYVYTNGEWVQNNYKEIVTDQFVLSNAKWNYDPSTVIELLPTKNDLSILYYQTATDWVWDNIDQKILTGDDKGIKGKGYVTSYGNNELYSGCSAYYGNIDMRPSAARGQYSAGYEGLSDDEVVALMKEHLVEVMQGVLEILNADATPVDGVEVLYTVKVGIYLGTSITTCTHQLVYKVIGKGKFEYVEASFQEL